MKQLMNNPVLGICFLIVFSTNTLCAQKIIDTTTDSNFDELRLSDLIRLRESLLYDDSIMSKRILMDKKFKKSDSCDNCFTNSESGTSLEFCQTPVKGIPMKDTYYDKYVLIYRGGSDKFKNLLEDFIRLQKINENLSVDEYEDELVVGFFDIYQQKKFFVDLHKNNYSLVIF